MKFDLVQLRSCVSHVSRHGAQKKALRAVLLNVLLLAAAQIGFDAHAQAAASVCGSLQNAFGPFDYRTQRGQSLYLVEAGHFTPKVEALIAGESSYLGGDLDYVLRAYPNHHRALLALIRLEEKEKSPQPKRLPRTIECYFERAIRFQRDDAIARMLYATYLGKHNRITEAKSQLQVADRLANDNAFTLYNIGMVYADLKDYEGALALAHKAYQLGFTQTGLRDRLKAEGKWREPN